MIYSRNILVYSLIMINVELSKKKERQIQEKISAKRKKYIKQDRQWK